MAEMKNKKFSEYLFCSRGPGFVKKKSSNSFHVYSLTIYFWFKKIQSGLKNV